MKLLIQSDDYGITRAVSRGILHGIENGLIRNTGIFTNMSWSEECAEWIKPYMDQIALGIDLNISTGSAVLSHGQIPSVTKEDGSFFSSSELRKKKDGEIDPEDVRKEFEAQIERYIRFFNKNPDYIHPHAFVNEDIIKIQRDLADRYGVPFSGDFWKKLGCPGLDEMQMPWYVYPVTYGNQLNCSLKDYILSSLDEWEKKGTAVIVCHAGYVDQQLMSLSSFNILRMKDLEALTDEEVLGKIEERNIQLISYRG